MKSVFWSHTPGKVLPSPLVTTFFFDHLREEVALAKRGCKHATKRAGCPVICLFNFII